MTEQKPRQLVFNETVRKGDILGAEFKTPGQYFAVAEFVPHDVIGYMLDPAKEPEAGKDALVKAFRKKFTVPESELKKAFGKICERRANEIYGDVLLKHGDRLKCIGLSEDGCHALFHGRNLSEPVRIAGERLRGFMTQEGGKLPDGLLISDLELIQGLRHLAQGGPRLSEEDIRKLTAGAGRDLVPKLSYSDVFWSDSAASAWAGFLRADAQAQPESKMFCAAPEPAILYRLTSVCPGPRQEAWLGNDGIRQIWDTSFVAEAELIRAARACEAIRKIRQPSASPS